MCIKCCHEEKQAKAVNGSARLDAVTLIAAREIAWYLTLNPRSCVLLTRIWELMHRLSTRRSAARSRPKSRGCLPARDRG